MNLLGSKPGASDGDSLGHPGKFTFLRFEDTPPAPPRSLRVELGYGEDDTTVTVMPAEGPRQLAQQLTHSAWEVLRSFACAIKHVTSFAPGKATGHACLALSTSSSALPRA